MLKCVLCGPISRNPADFEVFYGPSDRLLRVCRWCKQDLELLGFHANQVVRLVHKAQEGFEPFHFDWASVLGSVASLLEVSAYE